MYTSNKITGIFILIAIIPKLFLSSLLTKLSFHIYEKCCCLNNKKGLKLNFGYCHKLIIPLATKSLVNQILLTLAYFKNDL